jgi:hypothetical protein
LRPAPLVRAEVALYGPRRAGARLHPADGRWPERELADRIAVGIGLAALASFSLPAERWEPYRACLAGVASRVASGGDGPLRGDLAPLDALGIPGPLAVVPWEGPGRVGVAAEVLASRGGLVPRMAGEAGAAGPARQVAALALLVALAADADREGRLGLALAVEGLLAWFRESDRLAASRHALTFALAHARDRLREAGRPVPPGM